MNKIIYVCLFSLAPACQGSMMQKMHRELSHAYRSTADWMQAQRERYRAQVAQFEKQGQPYPSGQDLRAPYAAYTRLEQKHDTLAREEQALRTQQARLGEESLRLLRHANAQPLASPERAQATNAWTTFVRTQEAPVSKRLKEIADEQATDARPLNDKKQAEAMVTSGSLAALTGATGAALAKYAYPEAGLAYKNIFTLPEYLAANSSLVRAMGPAAAATLVAHLAYERGRRGDITTPLDWQNLHLGYGFE